MAPGARADWLIVDHYQLNADWEQAMRGSARRIFVIDDTADRSHDCDMILDQNFFSDMQHRYDGKVPAGARRLLGPRFALLRPEFCAARKQARARDGATRRVLVFIGGADATNYTSVAIAALARLEPRPQHVDVVIGAAHSRRAAIEGDCARYGFHCHVQAANMAELMLAADISIGAGGSASWERCCVGLPVLMVSVADNQVAIARELARAGAGEYLGRDDSVDSAQLAAAVGRARAQPGIVGEWSAAGMRLVDGMGAARVAQAMGELS
jgi:UDP-2,4-diacetamido-2,4,6-trideoxy-beta-L-altropyranose hydrolase